MSPIGSTSLTTTVNDNKQNEKFQDEPNIALPRVL